MRQTNRQTAAHRQRIKPPTHYAERAFNVTENGIAVMWRFVSLQSHGCDMSRAVWGSSCLSATTTIDCSSLSVDFSR